MSGGRKPDASSAANGNATAAATATPPQKLSFRAFADAQKNHTLVHPSLPQPRDDDESIISATNSICGRPFSFVIAADTQFGMLRNNTTWDKEMQCSRQAVAYINNNNSDNGSKNSNDRPGVPEIPRFCIVLGDLVHMEASIYAGQPKRGWGSSSKSSSADEDVYTLQECHDIQDQQFRDFKDVWSRLRPDVPLVCLSGNHDIGNRLTPASMQRFRDEFGDDRLAFWATTSSTKDSSNTSASASASTSTTVPTTDESSCVSCYCIVVNTNLFNDPTDAMEEYHQQIEWLEERLHYANEHQATHIFVFGHHPWFLYHEDENEQDANEMPGGSTIVDLDGGDDDGGGSGLPPPDTIVAMDSYFCIPRERRRAALKLFEKYHVTACFAGHFHQNLCTRTSFGMDMITTSALSGILASNGISKNNDVLTRSEPQARGLRVVHVGAKAGEFEHSFVEI